MTLAINISQQQQQLKGPASMLLGNESSAIRSNNTYDIMSPSSTESDQEEDEEEEDEDDDDMILEEEEGSSSMSSSPSIPDENINFDLVYALHTFTATVEGQASVFKGDALILMEDTNIYWWLVEVLKTQEIGYIPAENIETPYERLARLNKHRNVDITAPFPEDNLSAEYTIFSNAAKKVTIADDDCLEDIAFFEVESDLELDDDGDDNDDDDNDDDDLSIDREDGGDNESLQNIEEGVALADDEEQQMNITSTESLAHQDPSDGSTAFVTSSVNEQPQQQQQQQKPSQQQRPQRYLTPAHFKPDTSSHYLPGDGISFKRHSAETHNLRVFAGNIGQGPLFHSFDILTTTTTDHLLKDVVQSFNLTDMGTGDQNTTVEYYITVQGTDGDEYILAPQDKPCSIFKTLTASLTTPMPTVSQNICRKPQEGNGMTQRKRSSSFGNHEQTSYEEDSVIRFYIHRRIKHAHHHHERQGMIYIKVSLYPDEYASSGLQATFFNNNNNKKTISTTTTATIKTEIDRIDKILTVSYDTLVGSVISTALDKFHIPDAEPAKDRQQSSSQVPDTRHQSSQERSTTAKYVMSIRNGNGQETMLCTTDCISDVLHEQQQASHRTNNNNNNSSDYFFILRRCQPAKQFSYPSSFGFSSLSKKNRKVPSHASSSIGSSIGNMISGNSASGTRRPSILDILMDYTPPPPPPSAADDRRQNNSSSPKIMDRRRKGDQQDRSSSLNVLAAAANDQGLSPERKSSCPDLSTNDDGQAKQQNTPSNKKQHQHHDSIITMDNSKKRKEGSLKQQLKRLVTWGSSSSFKLKKGQDLTISTSLSSTSSFKSSTHSPIKALPTLTTLGSESGKTEANDTKPISMVTRVAVKSQYLRQQQEHEPIDKRRRQDMPPSPKTNLDSLVSEGSLSTTTSSFANGSSVSTSKQSSPNTYQHNDASSCNSSSNSSDDDEPTTLRDDDTTMTTAPVGMEQRRLTTSYHSGQSGAMNDNDVHDNNNTTNDVTAQQQQDELVDSDLFFLVTQGVDFLKTREGTKWEEDGEENGYQYHPWNWSSSSQQPMMMDPPPQASGNENNQETPTPPISTMMDKSLVSPPLSPLAPITQLKKLHIQKEKEEEKSRTPLPSVVTPKESPVDDEELQWIVNSHILF